MDLTARRTVAIWVALAMVVAIAFISAEPAEAAPSGQGNSELQWSSCYRDVSADTGTQYECTQVNVPLDYDKPNGAAVSLALVRIPAADQENRIGSLFLNPGGPGGSGVNFALFFGPAAPFIWGPVADQYDIVGFDPRGISRSTALRCFGNFQQSVGIFAPFPFPASEDEIPLFEAADQYLDDNCTQRGTRVVDHMSTANVARDLDVLRQRVGDELLNYVGLSYGTYLGQTYANLFPERVGAMVIDGNLDPIAWANVGSDVPFSTSLRSDMGAQDTLDEFLRQCEAAAAGNCAFAPDSADRLDALLERLEDNPILVTDPSTGETFPYIRSFLIGDLLGNLYGPPGYPFLAEFLAFLESSPDAESLGFARETMLEAPGFVTKRGFPNYPNFEGFPAVACSDTTNPDNHQAFFDTGIEAAAGYGLFGEIWTWAAGPCTLWSSLDEDAYKGPYEVETATPMLVIGNLYDPATRYEGAVTATGLLTNSVLLTVDEPGHTSLGLSGCAGFLTGLYLADPDGYAAGFDGAFCESEGNWFDKLAGPPPGAAGFGFDFRTQLMEEIAFRP